MTETAVMVDGVKINFPYRPYGPQIQIMRTVIKAAKNGQNALIDSPTGTGKTLALLCPLIAWQMNEQEVRTRNEREQPSRGGHQLDGVQAAKRNDIEGANAAKSTKVGSVTYGPAKSAVPVDDVAGSTQEADNCAKQDVDVKKLSQFDGKDDDIDIDLLEVQSTAGSFSKPFIQTSVNLSSATSLSNQTSSSTAGSDGNDQEEREARRKMRLEEKLVRESKMVNAFGKARERLAASAKRSRSRSLSKSKSKKRQNPTASQFDFENSTVTKLSNVKPQLNAFKTPTVTSAYHGDAQKGSNVDDYPKFTANLPEEGELRSKAGVNFDLPTNVTGAVPPTNSANKSNRRQYPRIIYATRTHKQIKHVIHELKKTAYRHVKMSILGSREYYCVNPLVIRTGDKAGACLDLQKGRSLAQSLDKGSTSSLRRPRDSASESSSTYYSKTGTGLASVKSNDLALNSREETLANARQCPYHVMTRNFSDPRALKRVKIEAAWDIEEIVGALKNQRACPYYVSKQLATVADVIFCPYNYLLDPSIRDAMQVDELIHDAVVVFDEAHNIEQSARDGASCEADSLWMADCLIHIENCMMASKRLQNELSTDKEHHYLTLQSFVRQLAQVTHNVGDTLAFERDVREDYTVKSGRDILAILRELDIDNAEKIKLLNDHVAAVADTERDENGEDRRDANALDDVHLATVHVHRLRSIFRVAGFALEHLDDYRLAVVRTRSMQPDSNRRSWSRAASNTFSSQATVTDGWLSSKGNGSPFASQRVGGKSSVDGVQIVTTIKFWCLSPSIAFSMLAKHVRCVVLASGTLSPTVSFASELGAVFPHSLETQHVVPAENTFCAALTSGPRGSVMKFVHRTNEDLGLQDELGETIALLCETVPFGVLCFVASYAVLDRLTSRWRLTGAWQRIQAIKHVFVESRFERKAASTKSRSNAANSKPFFDEAEEENDATGGLDGFYQRIAELEAELSRECDGYGESIGNAFEWNARRIRAGLPSGALLFAVCRGRVSEGLDFTDNQARAVITIGIPYPNIFTPEVKLKMEYNDLRRRMPPPTSAPQLNSSDQHRVVATGNPNSWLGGREWYSIEAFRALNQALGRCIRHRNDWGIIMLIDERFGGSEPQTNASLSCWLRQRVTAYRQFPDLRSSVEKFLRQKSLATARSVAAAKPKDDLDINFDRSSYFDKNGNSAKSGSVDSSASSNSDNKQSLNTPKPGTVTMKSNTFGQLLKDASKASKLKLTALAQSTQVPDAQRSVAATDVSVASQDIVDLTVSLDVASSS